MVNLNSIFDIMGVQKDDPKNKALEKKTGVESSTALKLAALAVPLILRGISKNMEAKDQKESFSKALDQHKGKVSQANSIEDLIINSDEQDGSKILGHVFQDKDSVVSSLAEKTGVSQDNVSKVMASVAPIVMQMLAQKKDTDHLDDDGVMMETEKLRKDAETRAASDFNLLDIVKQVGGQDEQKDEGLGGIVGSLFGNLFKK